jgi:cysteine-rich repeat protein
MFGRPQRLHASILLAALLTFGCPGSSPDDAACGDGVVEGSEVCDDGNAITELACAYGTRSCTACDAACTRSLSLVGAYCGNAVLNAVESCDDGNTAAGDGCTATCEMEPGYDCFEPTGCVVAPVLARTTSGALAPLDGTAWTYCVANSPMPGQSKGRTEAFEWPDVTLTQDLYTASADCTGPTDPAAHVVVRAAVVAVTDRTVGWSGAPPAGAGPQVLASGLTLADPNTREIVARDLRLLDAAAAPRLLYVGNADGELDAQGFPTELDPAAMRDARFAPPPTMLVKTASGETLDLANTTWTTCEAGYPQVGQSYWHAWTFGSATATITHEVHLATTDCTGETDPAEHFSVTMGFQVGPDRTVGWQEPAPPAYSASVVASGVTFSDAPLAKGVAFVDDQRSPPLLFITNPGDEPPPLDAAGYPTLLPSFASAKQ